MKLLSPYDVAEETGLPYAKALLLVKAMPYIQIQKRYYVSRSKFDAFLSQNKIIEIMDTAS